MKMRIEYGLLCVFLCVMSVCFDPGSTGNAPNRDSNGCGAGRREGARAPRSAQRAGDAVDKPLKDGQLKAALGIPSKPISRRLAKPAAGAVPCTLLRAGRVLFPI